MSKTCKCGHHQQAHLGETGLCGSPEMCACTKFVPETPDARAFRVEVGR